MYFINAVHSYGMFADLTTSALSINDMKYQKIVDALHATEYIKNDIGLSDINFSDFAVGDAIYAYDYIDSGYVKTREYFPLFINNKLTAFAIQTGTGDEEQYQITTALVSEINAITNISQTNAAFVFDRIAAYIYTNDSIDILKKFDEEIENRDIIDCVDYNTISAVHLHNCNKQYDLNYFIVAEPHVQTYYSCNVSYVTQNPYTNLCWAACVAMVANYKKGTSLTAQGVAQTYFGSNSSFNYTCNMNNTTNVLVNTYKVSGYVCREVLSNDAILNNLMNNYPILGGFINQSNPSFHMIVIYSTNVTNGDTYAMDPMRGRFKLSYSSSTNRYYYVSPTTNSTYIWIESSSRY